MKTGASLRDVDGRRSTLVLMSVWTALNASIRRCRRMPVPMPGGKSAGTRTFDEIAQKTADEIVRVRTAQRAVGKEIHAPPIEGAAMKWARYSSRLSVSAASIARCSLIEPFRK